MHGMAELQQKVHRFALELMENKDMLLDVPFSAEEVSTAVSKLIATAWSRWVDGWRGSCAHLVIECPEHYCGIGGYSRCTEERGGSTSASLQGEWEGPTVGRQLLGSDTVIYGGESFGVSLSPEA